MNLRLKAFGLHFLASVIVLALTLGALYAGWYLWPGWYLTRAPHVAAVLVGVDVALGPLLTLIVADPRKPRRELTRDIGLIVVIQLAALGYGATTLWGGRPLYYAFSVNELELIQASDLDPPAVEIARATHAPFTPRWLSRPRWIWAPLPDDPKERVRIMRSAILGGPDVTAMPQYFRPWLSGVPALRQVLQPVDAIRYFSPSEIKTLERRLRAAGIPVGRRNSIPLIGRGRPLLAVFDPSTMRLAGLFACR